jgi:hypothetical protein
MPTGKSKTSAITLLIILFFGIIAWGLKKCNQSKQNYPNRTVNAEAGDWRHHKIIYTKHARCRMECREITEDEVNYILENGTINEEKSDEEDDEAEGHCQSFALEGITKDGQNVRIVFGACEKITKVIRVFL